MADIRGEKITSRKNPGIISTCALADKKARDKSGLFAAEGIKLLCEILCENVVIDRIYHTRRAASKYSEKLALADEKGAALFEVTDEVYDKLSFEKNPEGIFTVAKKTKIFSSAIDTPGEGGFVILDAVQNPSNVGTVIRTAAALGVSRILLGEGCADVFGPKSLRAAMGALFKVNICVTDDICGELGELASSGAHIYGAALDKNSCDIREVSFLPDDCIVLGNEGNGISDKVLSLCDKKIIIPMQRGTESLNAASAASILIWEKQKGALS